MTSNQSIPISRITNLPSNYSSLICQICKGIPLCASKCSKCSSLFCKGCITKYVESNKGCLCKSPFIADIFNIENSITKIDTLEAQCLFHNQGCKFVGKINNTSKHELNCKYKKAATPKMYPQNLQARKEESSNSKPPIKKSSDINIQARQGSREKNARPKEIPINHGPRLLSPDNFESFNSNKELLCQRCKAHLNENDIKKHDCIEYVSSQINHVLHENKILKEVISGFLKGSLKMINESDPDLLWKNVESIYQDENFGFQICSCCQKMSSRPSMKKCASCENPICVSENNSRCNSFCGNTCSSCKNIICHLCIDNCQFCLLNKGKNKNCSVCKNNDANLSKCNICSSSYCKNCAEICPNCKKENCLKDTMKCTECKKVICKACISESQKPGFKSKKIIFKQCSDCKNELCNSCFKTCECNQISCSSCSSNCNICSKLKCTTCMKSCGICKDKICSSCNYVCKSCIMRGCKKCTIQCTKCQNYFCVNCYQNCNVCETNHCLNCKKQCALENPKMCKELKEILFQESEIKLINIKMTIEDFKSLSNYFDLESKVSSIHLCKNLVSEKELKILIPHMKNLSQLNSFTFCCNRLDNNGPEIICELLNQHPSIRKLCLGIFKSGNNKLGDKGVKIMINNFGSSTLLNWIDFCIYNYMEIILETIAFYQLSNL